MGMVKEVDPLIPSVLVVDANARHCLLYQIEMEAQGYQVFCAHNGHEARQQIQHRRFDVAVVDVILPDVNGLELVKEISATHRNLPIIVNTAYPYRKSHVQKWAVYAFVLKSSNLNELMDKITLSLQRRRELKSETVDC
jgi:DNA-binding response OmpR family regulator